MKINFDEFIQFCFDNKYVGTYGDCCVQDLTEAFNEFIKSKRNEITNKRIKRVTNKRDR